MLTLTGTPFPVKKESSDEAVKYLLVNSNVKEKYTIEAVDRNAKVDSIAIFEIEKHDDTLGIISELESGNLDFYNHPLLKLIYSELFNNQ